MALRSVPGLAGSQVVFVAVAWVVDFAWGSQQLSMLLRDAMAASKQCSAYVFLALLQVYGARSKCCRVI